MSESDSKATGLTGHLEDLPFMDILQVVAYSKKSGDLQVEGPQGKGRVVFREGLVFCAYSWSTREHLREIGTGSRASEVSIQKHVELSLRELASLREGTFQFQLAESPPDRLDGISIAAFAGWRGLSPQSLLLDLARDIDEDREKASAALEATGPEEPSAGTARVDAPAQPAAEKPEPPGGGMSLLLVDDEPPVIEEVSTTLRGAGYRVYTASTPSEAAGIASELTLSREPFLVVTDLEMPSTSGRSFFGGLELMRLLKKRRIEVPIVLTSESVAGKAHEKARELGARSVALKPSLSKPDPEQYRSDLKRFARNLIAALERANTPLESRTTRSQVKGEEDGASAPFLEFISRMSERLFDPRRSRDVSRMVLEVAAHYLERGVIFLIKGEKATGLGGFGLGASEEESATVARQIQFDIQDARPFVEVAYSGKSKRLRSELYLLERPLYARIGRGRARECVLLPMLNHGEVLIILYGDNAESGRSVGKLRGLELFISQAGMALENRFLHQKLRLLESQLSVGNESIAEPS